MTFHKSFIGVSQIMQPTQLLAHQEKISYAFDTSGSWERYSYGQWQISLIFTSSLYAWHWMPHSAIYDGKDSGSFADVVGKGTVID